MKNVNKHYSIQHWTVKELLEKIRVGEIKLNDSTLQRREIASREWNAKLVKSVALNRSISAIHFAWTTNENNERILVCVDGLQRSTALVKFYCDEVKLPHSIGVKVKVNDEEIAKSLTGTTNMTLTQLKNAGREELVDCVIGDHKLDIYVYTGLTPTQIQHLFVLLNSGNVIKDQEKRNAYPTPIAEAIRQIARGKDIRDIEGKVSWTDGCHPIFDGQNTKNNYKSDKLKFKNNRYAYDELVAKMLFLLVKSQEDVTGKDLDIFYEETAGTRKGDHFNESQYPRRLQRLEKTLTRIYNWIVSTGSTDCYFQKKSNDFLIFVRVLWELENNNKKVENPEDFLKTYDQLYFQIMYREDEDGNRDRTRLKGQTLVNKVYELLVITQTNGIIEQDTTRLFSDEQKRIKWEEQGRKCAYTGLPLELEDAAGDHVLVFSKGGFTEDWNLAMVNSSLNSSRGATPWYIWMATHNFPGLNDDKLPPMPMNKIIEHKADIAGNDFMENIMEQSLQIEEV